MTPIFYGIAENGRLKIDKRDRFQKYLNTLKGRVILTLQRSTPKMERSTSQNRYYWGVLIRMVADEMGHLVPDDAHDFMKRLFLKRGIDFKGKRYEVVGSTASLDTIEFEKYLDRCRQWAAQELNLVIPLPNEIIEDY